MEVFPGEILEKSLIISWKIIKFPGEMLEKFLQHFSKKFCSESWRKMKSGCCNLQALEVNKEDQSGYQYKM